MATENCTRAYTALRDGEIPLLMPECVEGLLQWLCGGQQGEAEIPRRILGDPAADRGRVERVYRALDTVLFSRGELQPVRGTQAEKRKRYRLLVRAFHPDRYMDADDWLIPRSQIINAAYVAFRANPQSDDEDDSEPDWPEEAVAAYTPPRPPRRPKRIVIREAGLFEWLIRITAPLARSRYLPQKILGVITIVCVVVLVHIYFTNRPVIPGGSEVAGEPVAMATEFRHEFDVIYFGDEAAPFPVSIALAEEPVAVTGQEQVEVAAVMEEVTAEADVTVAAADAIEPVSPAVLIPVPEPEALIESSPAPVLHEVIHTPLPATVQTSLVQTGESAPDPQPEIAADIEEPAPGPEPYQEAEIRLPPLVEHVEPVPAATFASVEPGPPPRTARPEPSPPPVVVRSDTDTRVMPEERPEPVAALEPVESQVPPVEPVAATRESFQVDPVVAALAVMEQYRRSFERGQLQSLLYTLADSPRENQHAGVAWFRQAYGDLFARTADRSLKLDFRNKQDMGSWVELTAEYQLDLVYQRGGEANASGRIYYELVSQGDDWKISRIQYDRSR